MMAIRQTRIYAPRHPPYDTQLWAETMMGRIIKPLIDSSDNTCWFWFTRYSSLEPEFVDSDEATLPSGFFDNNQCRSLRFRYEISDDHLEDFEDAGRQLIEQEGCWIADWRDYGVRELCSNRFIGEDRSEDRRVERLSIVKQYVCSVSQLTLHALVPADSQGRFRFEQNDDHENPNGSQFFSLHHLFCNPTDVLLTAIVASNGSNLECGTHQNPPDVLRQNQNLPFVEFRVRF